MYFALRDFMGNPKRGFSVNIENLPNSAMTATSKAPDPGHFIFICDASGSMWGQMGALRALVVKLLTLEEYRDADVLVSVLSFADSGDLVTHASRVKIGDFMSPDSKALAQVQTLGTRGCTCISQGLRAVDQLLGDEVTVAVVLSDGFANDVSPGAEKREIDHVVETLCKRNNLVVNTISLGSWADFTLLSSIANACSGTCFAVPSAKEVYDVIHGATTLVAGQTTPALDVPMNGSDYVVFVSKSAGKIVGGSQPLLIRGLRPEDDGTIYRYRKTDAASADNAPTEAILAFAKSKLAEGSPNEAKFAIVASRDQTLLGEHARAIINTEFAAMSAALERVVLFGTPPTHTLSQTYGLPNAGQASVLQVLGILGTYAGDIEVNMTVLTSGYKKRGIKRINGTRNPDGTVIPFPYKLASKTPSQFRRVSSFDLNRNNATVNMLVMEPGQVVKVDDGTVVDEVMGIKVAPPISRYYTIIGDGMLNVKSLTFKITNKRLFRALVTAGALADSEFDATVPYTIDLTGRPLIGYDTKFEPNMLDGVFDQVLAFKIVQGILSATLKGQSDAYTVDQLAALKAIGVSGGMNFSCPTTNEYADLKQALTDGVIDTRLSYKVDFGSPFMIAASELPSANAFLARRFTMAGTGVDPKKPKFDARWEADVTYGIKALTGRTVLNATDDVMYPIYLDFLGLVPNGSVDKILADAGADADLVSRFASARAGKLSKDAAVEVFTDAKRVLDDAVETLFQARVAPLVFYVGASGMVPDEFQSQALTAEQVRQKYPKLDLGKLADETTYYVVGDSVLLSVYCKAEYFSTGKVTATIGDDDD